MSRGPWSVVVRRTRDGHISHAWTTPSEVKARAEATRITQQLRREGAPTGAYMVLVIDRDSANQSPIPEADLPAKRGIIIPAAIRGD
jgi:hypothetical protein